MTNVAVGFIGNGAGIDNDNAGVVRRCRNRSPGAEELVLNCGTLGLRGSAPEICDVEGFIWHLNLL
jgi:hypothetical protein